MTIKFGTDGWRAVISETFTFGNLRLVAQAIADFVREQNDNDPSVIIGFDTRFLSDRYAAEVARVMAANQITSWLARADTPTPTISHSVVHKKATAGIMITASHNAPRYNGVKLKASYGGSATPAQNKRVEYLLDRNLETVHGPNLMDLEDAVKQGLVNKFDPAWAYYEHLSTLIDLDVISSGELRVVADGMYGSGRGAIGEVLARGRSRVHNIRHEMNPGFGGIHPEPIAKHLGMLMSTIQGGHWDVGLATDGDADRIGAVDARGEFVDPHRIFALVLRYLIEKRGWTGKVVRTVSTTRMVDRIAADHGLPLVETPVGFNHIADLMVANGVLMGGEESGGISIKGHIPEGDGVLMGLLLLEVMAEAQAPLHVLVADLLDKYGPAQYARTDMKLKRPINKSDMVKLLVDSAPAAIAGVSVEEVQTVDGVKYYLDDGSWLLIRPSGTEPVLRVYAEAPNDARVKALLGFGEDMAQKA
ncbi:MAG: phosphoglucomutase/phosphomannomutase family protein [Chloroflexi bacterium]|nr:phosphoglucomutase/phosphomannomutase family protein [Chloroflexota bacterium]MBK6709165.1 phosphoglucomutase/phosphomannomutase family protein [Chloroflexota bacterium]MBK7175659.1 phosphoglucomutase/phosphomannomutase family protein [Chloroflexota bacterium]MBK7914942.1 phosphoglucomutase/phosphomannomutase family protein [Chloroflexota bacterium]MBP6803964.1 phosphoglucomutase/phosphomannomutase family protein [Chloroflexota bacterium]